MGLRLRVHRTPLSICQLEPAAEVPVDCLPAAALLSVPHARGNDAQR